MRTHTLLMGYFLWLTLGLFGVHRFYFGRRVSGYVYLCTAGLFGLGFLADAFLIPGLKSSVSRRYQAGTYSYTSGWLLLLVFGVFGAHRFYVGQWKSGLLYAATLGLLGLGVLFDLGRLNELLSDANELWISGGGEATNERALYV